MTLLQSALERPPEERDAFLRHACAGDEALEREVRSLLASQQQAEAFWRVPLWRWPREPSRATERRLAGKARLPSVGQTVSHYRIVEKWAAAAWAWSTRPRTPGCTALSLSNFCPTNSPETRKP